jgi:hypothetical protein
MIQYAYINILDSSFLNNSISEGGGAGIRSINSTIQIAQT